MKKNFVKASFVVAIVMVSGINMFSSQKSETLSEVALANVEALAADDDSTEICERRIGSECYEFVKNPSGNGYHVWLDMINKTF